jgi:hypothetical protein
MKKKLKIEIEKKVLLFLTFFSKLVLRKTPTNQPIEKKHSFVNYAQKLKKKSGSSKYFLS